MPSAIPLSLQIPPNSVGNITLQSASVSGNVIAQPGIGASCLSPSSVSNSNIQTSSVDITKLQNASVSGSIIFPQAVLPIHVLGGLQANRNKIINGDFAVWQRLSGLGFDINTSAPAAQTFYTADRWAIHTEVIGGVSTSNGIWRVFPENRLHPNNIDTGGLPWLTCQAGPHCVKILCSGSDTTVSTGNKLTTFQTVLENTDLLDFSQTFQNVVASFWVRSSKTGKLQTFMHPYNNGTHLIKSAGGGLAVALGTVTINAVDTWEYHKVLLFQGTTNGGLLNQLNDTNFSPIMNPALSGTSFGFVLQAGNQWQSPFGGDTLVSESNQSNNATMLAGSSGISFNTAGDYLYLTNVQIESIPLAYPSVPLLTYGEQFGNVTTPFESISYQQQLAKCQRYCYVIGCNGGGDDGINSLFGFGASTAANAAEVLITYPVPLRHNVPNSFFTLQGVAGSFNFTGSVAGGICSTISYASNVSSKFAGLFSMTLTTSPFAGANIPGWLECIASNSDKLIFNADF